VRLEIMDVCYFIKLEKKPKKEMLRTLLKSYGDLKKTIKILILVTSQI